MERISTKFIVGWLALTLVLASGVVGCGAITHHDGDRKSPRRGPGLLEECELATGQQGLLYDNLCLPAPPAGWTGPKLQVAKVSFLHRQESGDCRRNQSVGVFVAV